VLRGASFHPLRVPLSTGSAPTRSPVTFDVPAALAGDSPSCQGIATRCAAASTAARNAARTRSAHRLPGAADRVREVPGRSRVDWLVQ